MLQCVLLGRIWVRHVAFWGARREGERLSGVSVKFG